MQNVNYTNNSNATDVNNQHQRYAANFSMTTTVEVENNKKTMCSLDGRHDMRPSLQFKDCVHPLGCLDLDI